MTFVPELELTIFCWHLLQVCSLNVQQKRTRRDGVATTSSSYMIVEHSTSL